MTIIAKMTEISKITDITSDDLKKLILLTCNDEEYNEYLIWKAKLCYKESLDTELQKYYENFKKLPHDEKWNEKIRYLKQQNNPDYNNGMSNWNEEDEQKYIKKYISENFTEHKQHFINLCMNKVSLYKNITLQLIIDNLHIN